MHMDVEAGPRIGGPCSREMWSQRWVAKEQAARAQEVHRAAIVGRHPADA